MSGGGVLRGIVAAGAWLALASPAAAQQAMALSHYDLRGPGTSRIELGASLAELSGLAFDSDGRLLGHGDEQAVIWQIDRASGSSTRAMVLTGARGVLQGDFEDMQVVGDHAYLVTSSGDLLDTRWSGNDSLRQPTLVGGGLEGVCTVEGLAWDEPSRSFLLLCKQTRSKRWRDDVVVLGLSGGRLDEHPRILVHERDLERVTGTRHFNGTAMVRHPISGTYILLAGPQHAYAEVDGRGRVLGGGHLDAKRHRQPESIAIAPDLSLLIGDEADGKIATITAYAWRR
jgi:hypothetical protein